MSQTRDFDTMGDALLALSAMRGLGSVTRRDRYLDAIIFAMEADKPSRLRHAALRAVFDARLKLELAPTLFAAAKPIAPQHLDDELDVLFDPRRDDYYLRLIFTLAKQSDWCAHLERAGHIERCTSLLDHVIKNNPSILSVPSHPYYLAAILIRMNLSGGYRSSLRGATLASALDSEPTNEEECRPTTDLAATLHAAPEAPTSPGFPDNIFEQEWWKLLNRAWWAMRWNDLHLEAEALRHCPALSRTLSIFWKHRMLDDEGSFV
ncbi:uncharacterized protein F5891DRAFT_1275585 [Suillus fuscotomentosus]|uniref:Uncharacterized protein n=1 Tax=Suillus fuscotomentosus TaxID=1912939 RepID=A0AAD4HPX1_9AGAM|nr:uncharacterized protein F5891DRAFT_1275585 [Suillus fuscotomentosus]KAG1904633.1 hypothetical protein F5891DRAFT_1275585 [Suillus fuscotomentosus]